VNISDTSRIEESPGSILILIPIVFTYTLKEKSQIKTFVFKKEICTIGVPGYSASY
jgi:hypothetical protein